MLDLSIPQLAARIQKLESISKSPLNWRGPYIAGTIYTLYDVVSNGGITYICIKTNFNNAPPNGTYWLALPGTDASVVPITQIQVALTGTQTLTTGVTAYLGFNTETYKIDITHDIATNNSAFTIQKAGLYALGASVGYDVSGTGERWLYLETNGGSVWIYSIHAPVAGSQTWLTIHRELRLAVGDVVRFGGFQSSGGNLNIVGSFAWMSWRSP